jgi:hypothetical protein
MAVGPFPPLSSPLSWAPADKQYLQGLANGQVDIVYAARLTVAAGTPVSIDLSGALKDLLGNAAIFAEIAAIGFLNNDAAIDATVTGNWLTSRFGASSSWPIQAKGRIVMDFPNGGLVVTNSTADVLTFTAASGTITIDVVVGGRSA